MNPLKNPVLLKRFHAAATVFWLVAAVPTVVWLKDSILWVALMSVWANVAGHWSAWQGVRAEEEAKHND